MSAELFDLVNIRDEVIGTTSKEVAHTTGQLHRVAAVFVFNHSGDLFVQEHPSDGKWDHSVGGHVSRGESYADAAAREAEEELGVWVVEVAQLADVCKTLQKSSLQDFALQCRSIRAEQPINYLSESKSAGCSWAPSQTVTP